MIKIRTLDSGLRIATETIPSVRSCGVGLWLDLGSRYESPGEEGLTHFIEHMLFKGTGARDTRQIGDFINYLGGNVNAFTTQEMLCLHARTVDRKAHEALDFLADLVLESNFPELEIRRERQVVLEEVRMYEDNPDDLSVDTFVRNLWPTHPLGRPVIGYRKTIRQFSREGILDYWAREFRPDRLLIALAGAFDAKEVGRVIKKRFGSLAAPKGINRRKESTSAEAKPKQSYLARPVEQAHFCLGSLGPARTNPERFAFGLMNMILGGGMSSRLFQEIREKRGLAYSIGSFTQLFSDRGFVAISGGTNSENLSEVLRITMDEIAKLCDEEAPEEELFLAREQVLDSILMGLENTESRMTRIAESILAFGRVVSIDEAVEAIKRVGPSDVRAMARKYLGAGPFAVSSVGPREAARPSGRLCTRAASRSGGR